MLIVSKFAHATASKKRAMPHDIGTGAPKKRPNTVENHERGTKISPWSVVEGDEEVETTPSEGVQRSARTEEIDALMTKKPGRPSEDSPDNVEIQLPGSMLVDTVFDTGSTSQSSVG